MDPVTDKRALEVAVSTKDFTGDSWRNTADVGCLFLQHHNVCIDQIPRDGAAGHLAFYWVDSDEVGQRFDAHIERNLTPLPRATSRITPATPMMMLSMVSTERIRLACTAPPVRVTLGRLDVRSLTVEPSS